MQSTGGRVIASRWSWDNLRFFLALARQGTLVRAAESLRVSHTTVFRRIRAFEAELGARLFENTPGGQLLTAAGERLLREVSQVEDVVDTISREIAGADQRIEGEVILTTPDSIGLLLMPQIMRKLSAAHPYLRLKLRIASRLANLSHRDADIAVRASLNPPPHLVGRRIGAIGYRACAAVEYLARHPLADLAGAGRQHHFIVLDEGFAGMPAYEWLKLRLPEGARTTEVDGFMAALELCRAGIGITVLPSYILDLTQGLKPLRVAESIENNELWLLTHRDLRSSARIRAVMTTLSDELLPIFGGAGAR